MIETRFVSIDLFFVEMADRQRQQGATDGEKQHEISKYAHTKPTLVDAKQKTTNQTTVINLAIGLGGHENHYHP